MDKGNDCYRQAMLTITKMMCVLVQKRKKEETKTISKSRKTSYHILQHLKLINRMVYNSHPIS